MNLRLRYIWTAVIGVTTLSFFCGLTVLRGPTRYQYHENYANPGTGEGRTTAIAGQNDFENPLSTLQRIQAERHDTLRTVCRAHGLGPPVKSESLERFIVDTKHKVAYCPVAKAGSTSWTTLMLDFIGGKPDTLHVKFLRSNESFITYISNFNEKEAREFLSSFYSFIFVRNPWSRLMAAHQTVRGEFTRHYYKQLGKLRGYDKRKLNDPATFTEFIAIITHLNEDLEKVNMHWRPVYLWCRVCQVNYTFLGRLEDIDTEAPYVMEQAFHQDASTSTFPKKNRARQTRTQQLLVQAYKDIPDEQLAMITKMYRLDFEIFGYSKDYPR